MKVKTYSLYRLLYGKAMGPLLMIGLLMVSGCQSPADMSDSTTVETAPSTSALEGISNPLIEKRADPWCMLHTDGHYYFTATVPQYDRIELRSADTLAGLAQADAKVIWTKHDSGPMGAHIWAPELHHIDGKWYIYFAAGDAHKIWNIRPYVLECTAADPMQGEWVEKGEIKLQWDSFSLDATHFENKGEHYLVWAQSDPNMGRGTNLYISQMDTPWSLKGKAVMITMPEYDWEIQRFRVNEGAAVLFRNDRIFLTYSASGTDHNYCMGMLTASQDADLMDPGSWSKSEVPVFRTSEANSQFGPGHNSFTTSKDGQTDILVYHARNYMKIIGDPLRNPDRHTRIQPFTWNADGTPNFGKPVADGPLTETLTSTD